MLSPALNNQSATDTHCTLPTAYRSQTEGKNYPVGTRSSNFCLCNQEGIQQGVRLFEKTLFLKRKGAERFLQSSASGRREEQWPGRRGGLETRSAALRNPRKDQNLPIKRKRERGKTNNNNQATYYPNIIPSCKTQVTAPKQIVISRQIIPPIQPNFNSKGL